MHIPGKYGGGAETDVHQLQNDSGRIRRQCTGQDERGRTSKSPSTNRAEVESTQATGELNHRRA